MKLSIIIPVYNASSYLPGCLERLIKQPFQSIEIILVDDGSTDTSASICDEYAQKDHRIRVKHELHAGVAHSRQIGFEEAQGDYILYVDADDAVDTNMITDMYQKAIEEDADMVICDYRELIHDGVVYRKQEPSTLSGVVVLN